MYEAACQLCFSSGIISVLSTCARTCFGRGLLYYYIILCCCSVYLEHPLILCYNHNNVRSSNTPSKKSSLWTYLFKLSCWCAFACAHTCVHSFMCALMVFLLACFSVSFSLFSMLLLISFYDCVNNSFLFSCNGLCSPMEKWHMKKALLLSLFTGVQMSCGTCTTFLEPLSHERWW